MRPLIREHKLIVSVGSGGVGKTTVSAVIALQAAIEGQRALVLTVDPAKRLANSLGIAELDNEIREIPLEQFRDLGIEPAGSISAMMLDMKESMDQIIEKYAPNRRAREEILANDMYHYLSTSLAGAQEYAAGERIIQIYEESDFDLIVLDTPPTTRALDFIRAPERMVEAIDRKAVQWFSKRGAMDSGGFGWLSMGSSYVSKVLSRFTGRELLDELPEFLGHFTSLTDAFKNRAREFRDLLTSDRSEFLMVTSPDHYNIIEAIYFQSELEDEGLGVGGFIVNRVLQDFFGDIGLRDIESDIASAIESVDDRVREPSLSPTQREALADSMCENARELDILAAKDRENIGELRNRISKEIPIKKIPMFSRDIHSIGGLNLVRERLFCDESSV